MKTLVTITAHLYDDEGKITYASTRYSFVRPRSFRPPTYLGAARMVARDIGAMPSQVSVERIETVGYAAR